jgi:hypothetical protein
MNQLALLKRYYKEVDPQILAQYRDAEKSVWVNTDDKDLIPIEIELPLPPEPHLIDNFGLPAEDQKWHPPKLPKRLKELEAGHETLDEIWEEMDAHKDIFAEEIKFIEIQWERRLNGYWFWNNGVPTYIDGWHYFYCGWFNIDMGLPKYRDRDRKFFLFARKIYTETKAPKIDAKGYATKDKKGEFEWVEFGRRLFYGFNYPKHRREGATYKAECINYEIISRISGAKGGIQSMNDKSSRACFLVHLVQPWKKLPFFFKPSYEGSTSPKTELSFSPPAVRLSSKGSLSTIHFGLESSINYAVADARAYDGWKLYFHHDDEVGKLTEGLSCWTRHLVVKECLGEGANIRGFTIKTSTVGEMEKGGGRAFKHQCQMSDYYKRNPNGQTDSGLATLFLPAYDGLDGFIDEYGNSIIDTPTKRQAKFIGNNIGAREYILNQRKGYIDKEDQEALSEEIRKFPIRFAECFRSSAKSSGFNINKLESYIDNLSFTRQNIAVGNLSWKDNIRDGKVIFTAHPQGKFRISHQLNDNESNKKFWSDDEQCWKPGNSHWGVAGGDPFKFNITKSNRKSKGGGAVVKKPQIRDGDFSMKRKFACTYAQRTYDKNIYGEDMLMMCIYFGVPMFPEIDYPFIWDYFRDRGWEGYLLYKMDPNTYKISNTPGDTANRVKQDIFTEYMTWIENEADEETHIEILEECRDIDGPEDMTNYDLFTAGGYALLGTRGLFSEVQEINPDMYKLDSYLKKRSYSFSRIH